MNYTQQAMFWIVLAPTVVLAVRYTYHRVRVRSRR